MTTPRVEISLVRDNGPSLGTTSSPGDVASLVDGLIGNKDREHFIALHLDSKHEVTSYETISIGNINASLVHPREVFKGAILANAVAIIVAHNHPSGNTTPSRDDNATTRRLTEAGELLGVKILDHVIVGPMGGYYSYAEHDALT